MAHDANRHDHKKAYATVWVSLLLLTVLTVKVAYYNFGVWNILIAMLVASIKASLVVLFFMHLKYDNKVNQVVFASAFVFLFIFVGLTASDTLYRAQEQPVAVEKTTEGEGVSTADLQRWQQATPALVDKGKTLYASQCATCHGTAGAGDGPAAPALNPKPRNLTVADGWKFGRTPSQTFKTLTEGSPGTAMASFSGLSVEDRWALVHYVRILSPNPPEDTAETVAATTGSAQGSPQPAKPRLPIPVAMQVLTEPPRFSSGHLARRTPTDHPGQPLYERHCANCHGVGGDGQIRVGSIGVNPITHIVTQPFSETKAAWVTTEAEFIRIVSEGLPGKNKPGIAHFSATEWRTLHEYVQMLAK